VLLPVLARRGAAAGPFRRWDADAAALAEVDELLDAFELGPLRREPAGNLAHGNERMLEVAMTLATRPRMCLLDEPCAGLNPAERRQILDLIARLERDTDTTFVLVEHDMEVVFAVSEWIVVLVEGAVLTEGPPERIRDDPRVRQTYLGEEAADDAGTA
jgi:branched-chain amino acid transport system ATP-binding protein